MKYNNAQHHEYLELMDRVGGHWLGVFDDDTRFYSTIYWDLLTHLWRAPGPVRKTDALKVMTGVKSPHTAGKYLDTALAAGAIIEAENPEDARSRLLTLSDDMRQKLDRFFDQAITELRKSNRTLDIKGPSPEAP